MADQLAAPQLKMYRLADQDPAPDCARGCNQGQSNGLFRTSSGETTTASVVFSRPRSTGADAKHSWKFAWFLRRHVKAWTTSSRSTTSRLSTTSGKHRHRSYQQPRRSPTSTCSTSLLDSTGFHIQSGEYPDIQMAEAVGISEMMVTAKKGKKAELTSSALQSLDSS
ncbi:hypothetical protein LTR85_003926 [Meristemomyces frigidus]|nr:hypothetical protein LTR85_003926 [Meristemomyces frigidus]